MLRVSAESEGETPAEAGRSGFAFLITHDIHYDGGPVAPKFRYNIRLLPNCHLPDQVWQDERFRQAVGERAGMVPIQLWYATDVEVPPLPGEPWQHVRIVQKYRTVLIPYGACDKTGYLVQVALDGRLLRKGDLLIVPDNPAMLHAIHRDGNGVYSEPGGSLIDNVSNDPTPTNSVRIEEFRP